MMANYFSDGEKCQIVDVRYRFVATKPYFDLGLKMTSTLGLFKREGYLVDWMSGGQIADCGKGIDLA